MMLVAGCDEAGRGALAGPIAAAAVILDPDIFIPGINDSKKLSRAARERTATAIEANAICWAVAFISSADIDEVGIQSANRAAMVEAVHKLVLTPDFLLSDGFKVEAGVRNRALIKGDSISLTIAAASIIAKRSIKATELSCTWIR
jgi:ribonuclease HII